MLVVRSNNVNKAWFWGYSPLTTEAIFQGNRLKEVTK